MAATGVSLQQVPEVLPATAAEGGQVKRTPITPKCRCGHSKTRHLKVAGACLTCFRFGLRGCCKKYRPQPAKPLKRSPLPKATKPIKARKTDPTKRRFAKHRDKAYTDWVSRKFCLLSEVQTPPDGEWHPVVSACWTPLARIFEGFASDPAHVIPRSRGSDDKGNVVNLCRKHHNEQEGKTAAFEAKYGLDLKALALELANRYGREQGENR